MPRLIFRVFEKSNQKTTVFPEFVSSNLAKKALFSHDFSRRNDATIDFHFIGTCQNVWSPWLCKYQAFFFTIDLKTPKSNFVGKFDKVNSLFNLEFVSRGFDNIEKKNWARTFFKMQIKITNFKVKKNWPSLVWSQNINKFRENSRLEEFNIFQNSKLKPEIKHETCLFIVYLIFRKSDWPHNFRNYLSGKFILFTT